MYFDDESLIEWSRSNEYEYEIINITKMGQTKKAIESYLNSKGNPTTLSKEDLFEVFRLGRNYGEYKNSIWNRLQNHTPKIRKIGVMVKRYNQWTIEIIDDSEFNSFIKENECKAWASLKSLLSWRNENPIIEIEKPKTFIEKLKDLFK